jgi:hypothetical protein
VAHLSTLESLSGLSLLTILLEIILNLLIKNFLRRVIIIHPGIVGIKIFGSGG